MCRLKHTGFWTKKRWQTLQNPLVSLLLLSVLLHDMEYLASVTCLAMSPPSLVHTLLQSSHWWGRVTKRRPQCCSAKVTTSLCYQKCFGQKSNLQHCMSCCEGNKLCSRQPQLFGFWKSPQVVDPLWAGLSTLPGSICSHCEIPVGFFCIQWEFASLQAVFLAYTLTDHLGEE